MRQVSVIQTVAHLSLKKDKQSLEILDQLKELMSLGATFVGLMIDSEKSISRDQLQDLIDELGILSLILNLDLEKETFSRISDSIHQIVPPETALICGGKSFLPEHIPHFAKINVDQHQ